MLWTLHANANRDAKKHPQPFHPADVHPYRERDDYEGDDGGPDWATIHQLAKIFPCTERLRNNARPQQD